MDNSEGLKEEETGGSHDKKAIRGFLSEN